MITAQMVGVTHPYPTMYDTAKVVAKIVGYAARTKTREKVRTAYPTWLLGSSVNYEMVGGAHPTILRTAGGEITLPMEYQGSYPSQTGAAVTADYYTARLPVGAGDVRYFIEAEDSRGNGSRSALERVYLG